MNRGDIMQGNFKAAGMKEAASLTTELENEAMARLVTLTAMRKAMLSLAKEWHAMGWMPVKYRE